MAYSNLFPFGDDRLAVELSHQTFWLRSAWLEEDDGKQPADFAPKFNNEGPKSEAQLIVDEILESLG